MNQYRISKYNPELRVDGRYYRDEWTSYSDVGKVYNGEIFTYEKYVAVEKSLIGSIKELVVVAEIKVLQIAELEDYNKISTLCNGQNIELKNIEFFVTDCHREKYWCKLNGDNFFIHFGYDYYCYVGCNLSNNYTAEMAHRYNLFCENMVSPYS